MPKSEKLQIRCEKHSPRETSSRSLHTPTRSAIWSPDSGSSSGTGERGGESRSKPASPECSYLKKSLLCFTSELPNTQSWPPAYAQRQQSWLIAHLSTVHAGSCSATERRLSGPVLCRGSVTPGLQTAPSRQGQTPGTRKQRLRPLPCLGTTT